jgi:hypothetical protein
MPERGHYFFGDNWLEVIWDVREGIEPDRPIKVGRVDVD